MLESWLLVFASVFALYNFYFDKHKKHADRLTQSQNKRGRGENADELAGALSGCVEMYVCVCVLRVFLDVCVCVVAFVYLFVLLHYFWAGEEC